MPTKAKTEHPASRARDTGALSLLSEWVRQGTQSFFATQRILLDLVMRQNANTMNIVRDRLSAARNLPGTVLTEMAGEGISSFIAAQRVVLSLAQRQNEIVMQGIRERAPGWAPVEAMTDMLRRGVDTFIDMQQHFLTTAAKQTDLWIDATKTGKPFAGKRMAELAQEAMEDFVRSQKKFLDVVAEEAAHATDGKSTRTGSHKTEELTELARQSAEAFIDAQKKLLDVAAQQMTVNVKAARRTLEVVNPLPPAVLGDLTKQTVESFVAAQKALLDVMAKPSHAAEMPPKRPKAPPRKRPATVKSRQTAAATA